MDPYMCICINTCTEEHKETMKTSATGRKFCFCAFLLLYMTSGNNVVTASSNVETVEAESLSTQITLSDMRETCA
eukprot:2087924-Karenia_brevis.AAC.1